MEMSVQPHVQAGLPMRSETGWSPEAICALFKIRNCLSLSRIEPRFLERSSYNLITTVCDTLLCDYILQARLTLRRQSIKKPNFRNSEPASAHSTLAMVALCNGDFKFYSDASSITPCQLIIELDALE